jgi:hypothetical protein
LGCCAASGSVDARARSAQVFFMVRRRILQGYEGIWGAHSHVARCEGIRTVVVILTPPCPLRGRGWGTRWFIGDGRFCGLTPPCPLRGRGWGTRWFTGDGRFVARPHPARCAVEDGAPGGLPGMVVFVARPHPARCAVEDGAPVEAHVSESRRGAPGTRSV